MSEDDVQAMIRDLPDKLVIEVGLEVLGDNDLDDLSEAPALVAARAGSSAASLEALARGAAADPGPLRDVLRLMLADIAATPDGAAAVQAAIARAGTKQWVLSPADLALISILISGTLAGYVAVRTGGRASKESETTTVYDKNGQLKEVKRRDKVVYLDPLGGLGKLLVSLLPKRGGEGKA